jgi:hypothetical protein
VFPGPGPADLDQVTIVSELCGRLRMVVSSGGSGGSFLRVAADGGFVGWQRLSVFFGWPLFENLLRGSGQQGWEHTFGIRDRWSLLSRGWNRTIGVARAFIVVIAMTSGHERVLCVPVIVRLTGCTCHAT